jgi:hypothetical protein
MKTQEAYKTLDLAKELGMDRVEAQFLKLKTEMEEKIASTSNGRLKQVYITRLNEAEIAYATLIEYFNSEDEGVSDANHIVTEQPTVIPSKSSNSRWLMPTAMVLTIVILGGVIMYLTMVGDNQIPQEVGSREVEQVELIKEKTTPIFKQEPADKTNNSITNHFEQEEFYILNIMAIKSKSQAIQEVEKLIQKGYDADFLWIPDYNSLSKAEYYSVYIGPFQTQRECEEEVERYRQIDPNAYGLLVSQENKRVKITGVNKVQIKEPYH